MNVFGGRSFGGLALKPPPEDETRPPNPLGKVLTVGGEEALRMGGAVRV